MGSGQLTPAVEVRPATTADAALLLSWANDPDTRAASFHPARIEPGEHAAWLARTLTLPTRRLLIGMLDGQPIGQVRLDAIGPGQAEVGISVDPDRRGLGLGSQLLAAGLEAGRRDREFGVERFVARVRVGNEASMRLFEHAGFILRETGTCEGVPCIVYELPA
ncbi:MAG TPA: GNAT family N-acetyltransferase [Candidatus Limnocylindrales bacterium]|nr:GNAT family N-acetyltransferase [Candidatus Limnocylindrales bacterium]